MVQIIYHKVMFMLWLRGKLDEKVGKFVQTTELQSKFLLFYVSSLPQYFITILFILLLLYLRCLSEGTL